MNFRQDAMSKLYPTWATIDGDTDVKDKDGKTIVIDESEISKEVTKLQAEWDSQEYARKRKAEYDALNQLEMQFDDKEDGTTTWEDAINAIKAKYPKG